MKTATRILWIFCALMLLLSACLPGLAAAGAPEIETEVARINKHGSLILNIKASTLLDLGYEYADVLSVTLLGRTLDMPLVSNYTDVDNGAMLVRAVYSEETGANEALIAINAGSFAGSLGIAEKISIDEEPGYRWDYRVETPVTVTISLKEKGGYADAYLLHQLKRSNQRADYPELTDAQYANFRNVATTGMGAWALFRSSSPVNPELNRNAEADEALNGAGIQTVMNLADSDESMRSYPGYEQSYYSQRNVIALNLAIDFTGDENKSSLAKGMAWFAAHEGPYLVHCTEGKDRAGFVAALLECLMGASAEEVLADYMVTFFNYYGVEPNTPKYDAIVHGNLAKTLALAFGVEDIHQADLATCAEAYLLSCGVTPETVAALKANLAKSYAE